MKKLLFFLLCSPLLANHGLDSLPLTQGEENKNERTVAPHELSADDRIRLDTLIQQLDDHKFSKREQAQRGLGNLGRLDGPTVIARLRVVLDAPPSLEVKRRIEELLVDLEIKPKTLSAREVLRKLSLAVKDSSQVTLLKEAFDRILNSFTITEKLEWDVWVAEIEKTNKLNDQNKENGGRSVGQKLDRLKASMAQTLEIKKKMMGVLEQVAKRVGFGVKPASEKPNDLLLRLTKENLQLDISVDPAGSIRLFSNTEVKIAPKTVLPEGHYFPDLSPTSTELPPYELRVHLSAFPRGQNYTLHTNQRLTNHHLLEKNSLTAAEAYLSQFMSVHLDSKDLEEAANREFFLIKRGP